MKHHTIAIVLAAYLLFLAAQAGWTGAPPAAPQERSAPGPENAGTAVYQLEPVTVSQSVRSQDKKAKELARWNYRLLTLSVTNPEELSPADREAAERNTETFNARMTALMEEYAEHGLAMGGDAEKLYGDGYFHETYYDEASASGAILGEVVSVRIDRSGYTGGAHPNSYATSLLFDLEAGQFLPDATQLADDPQVFQSGAAEKLVEKAEAIRENREVYWQDYGEIISRWNEGTVLFDAEGMTAVYSAYELGPYAMGAVELRLNWEELAGLMGPGGLARLGVELPEAAE